MFKLGDGHFLYDSKMRLDAKMVGVFFSEVSLQCLDSATRGSAPGKEVLSSRTLR